MRSNLIGGASGICHFVPGRRDGGTWAWALGAGPVSPRSGARPGAREAEERGWCGQARRGELNLINDATPLRVCSNRQDTLRRADRMFAVNLHVSSEGREPPPAALGPGGASVPGRPPARCLAAGRGGRAQHGGLILPLGSALVSPPKHAPTAAQKHRRLRSCRPGAGPGSSGAAVPSPPPPGAFYFLPQLLPQRPSNSQRTTLPRMPWSTSRV